MTRLARRDFHALRRAAAGIARCCRHGALAAGLGLALAGAATGAFAQAEAVRGEGTLGAHGGLPQWEDFYAQFEDLYLKLNGVNHLLLRFRTT